MSKNKKFKIIMTVALVVSLSLSIVFAVLFGVTYSDVSQLPDYAFDSMRESVTEIAPNADVRVMSYNVLVGKWGGYDILEVDTNNKNTIACMRAQMLNEMMLSYAPDVISLQEFSGEWHRHSDDIFAKYQLFDSKNSDWTTIAFNSDTTSLLDHGRHNFSDRTGRDNSGMRYVEWGLFQDKASSKKYIVTNTHLDFGAEKRDMQRSQIAENKTLVADLFAEHNVPVFITGDFNAREWGDTKGAQLVGDDAVDVYKAMLDSSFSIDTKYASGITTHFDSESEWAKGSWDHIYLKGRATVLAFGQLSSDYFANLSDHWPVYCDAII